MTTAAERRIKTLGAVAALLIAVGTIAAVLIRPVAKAEIRPVEEQLFAVDKRVTALETAQADEKRRLERIEDGIDRLIQMHTRQ